MERTEKVMTYGWSMAHGCCIFLRRLYETSDFGSGMWGVESDEVTCRLAQAVRILVLWMALPIPQVYDGRLNPDNVCHFFYCGFTSTAWGCKLLQVVLQSVVECVPYMRQMKINARSPSSLCASCTRLVYVLQSAMDASKSNRGVVELETLVRVEFACEHRSSTSCIIYIHRSHGVVHR